MTERVPRGRRRTVLVTGFGPFPGVPVNASADLALRLVRLARQRHRHVRFVAAVLPVSWHGAPLRLAHLIERHQPFVALHVGVSPRAEGFVLETVARNRTAPRADHRARAPAARRLVLGGADAHRVTLPVAALALSLDAVGLHAVCSDDAGDYLCNAVLYHSLAAGHRRRASGRCTPHRAGFLHIPTGLANDADVPSRLDSSQLLRGAVKILDVALARCVQPVPSWPRRRAADGSEAYGHPGRASGPR